MATADPHPHPKAARAALLAERRRLTEELGAPIEGPGQMTYGSQAAAATQVFEQQRDLALRERSRNDLGRVEAALRALDEGTYGTCTSCGQPIARERLEAIPWVPTCIDCARKAAR
jgi:RNA polymerase-binding protein DksA